MREKPNVQEGEIAACLNAHYGLQIASVNFLPIGRDLKAWVYQVIAENRTSYFLKIRSGPVHPPAMFVPRALIDHGIQNILAPRRTITRDLWCSMDSYSVILYPFIRGENAKVAGMSDSQWREFGATLGAIHSSGLASQFHGQVPAETFTLPSGKPVRRLHAMIHQARFDTPAAARLASFWRENAQRIQHLVERAEALGKQLQSKPFEYVLCHADIHGANILVGEDERIYLVDWDGPLIAPRERDLLFVVGSNIGRPVQPREEQLFFQGYGAVEIDPAALSYYRYERIIEDIGEMANCVFASTDLSEAAKAEETRRIIEMFQPGKIVASTLEADRS
jgi:spectinomycin phosphotransferase